MSKVDIVEDTDVLEKMLTDRIAELSDVKGMQSERHAFILYRSKVWNIQHFLKNKG